jgi:hypothetical protein
MFTNVDACMSMCGICVQYRGLDVDVCKNGDAYISADVDVCGPVDVCNCIDVIV